MKANAKILMIIDDESDMRTLLHDFFSSQGYMVHPFDSPEKALTALRTLPAPAAIMSHVRMYPISGIDLLRVANRDFPQVPVFLFTGDANPEEKAKAFRLGASHYLAKPFSLTKLKHLLEASLPAVSPGSPARRNQNES